MLCSLKGEEWKRKESLRQGRVGCLSHLSNLDAHVICAKLYPRIVRLKWVFTSISVSMIGMEAPTKQAVLALYKSLLREGCQFSAYNYRSLCLLPYFLWNLIMNSSLAHHPGCLLWSLYSAGSMLGGKWEMSFGLTRTWQTQMQLEINMHSEWKIWRSSGGRSDICVPTPIKAIQLWNVVFLGHIFLGLGEIHRWC